MLLNPLQQPQSSSSFTVEKKYETLDKGKKKFEVAVSSYGVTVKPSGHCWPPQIYLAGTMSKIMIGKSPTNFMTKISGGFGIEGSSVLLQTPAEQKDNIYWFVGDRIIQFKALAPISYFTSPVGPNKISYPWAQDVAGNIYLFDEDVVISHSSVNLGVNTSINSYLSDEGKDQIDAYRFFDDKVNFFCEHPQTKKIYRFTWCPNPESVVSKFKKSKTKTGDAEAIDELGESVWCSAIKMYGQNNGLYPLSIIRTLVDRSY